MGFINRPRHSNPPTSLFHTTRGITLLQSLIAAAILLIIAYMVAMTFNFSIRGIGTARVRTIALGVANEQIELFHNLPYTDVGIQGGTVPGVIPASQTTVKENIEYTIESEVLFIDDPFDGDVTGSIPEKPIDTEPADYKKVEIRVCWSTFPCKEPVRLTTTIVPNGLESAPNTGSLIIHVFNAGGLPVPQADVHIINGDASIDDDHTTDTDGNLALLSLPPTLDDYHLTITKDGFSTDSTLPATLPNPNPIKPDASVYDGGVTEVSFAIDLLSSLAVSTIDLTCNPIQDVSFRLFGEKLDYEDPDVLKYDNNFQTDLNGQWSESDIEWDNYTFEMNLAGYDIAGSNYPFTIPVLPQSNITLNLNLVPDVPYSLLVTVKDSASEAPLSGASVRVTNAGLAYDETIVTGQGSWSQTDWSGGSGQALWSNPAMYFNDDGNIDVTISGQMTLATTIDDTQLFEETFLTDTYKDNGATDADWDTSGSGQVTLDEDPMNPGQYALTGTAQSLTLNNESGEITHVTITPSETLNGKTITYEVASDGLNFESVTPLNEHTFTTTGNDLRWRAILTTDDPAVTPILNNITIAYTIVKYADEGMLESSTFSAGASSNFNFINWETTSQPPQTGAESAKFQVASNNDDISWTNDDFLGPDGTKNTYYTTGSDVLNAVHTDHQYVRYRVYLSTDDAYYTPYISDVIIIHSAGCLPSGQTFFTLPADDNYDIEVTLAGYDPYTASISTTGDYTYEVLLTQS